MSEVFVLFTMDVEPHTTTAGVSGPASDEAGMRAVRDYEAVLGEAGYRATYFVHPELVEAYPAFYRELEAGGSDVGLHLHTTKFALAKQPVELGGLTSNQQRDVLSSATGQFIRGMSRHPRIFRPGCFSANDDTFGVLHDLGFVGGGISIPGRIWPDRFCIWSGTEPYTHFAHRTMRQCNGDLPLVNIPLSVDLTTPLIDNPVGFKHHPDLRPGGVYTQTDEVRFDRRAMLANILRRMAADDPPVKTLVVDVHNDRDFVGDTQSARDLRAVIEGIAPECASLGWQPVASTYSDVIGRFFSLHGRAMPPVDTV